MSKRRELIERRRDQERKQTMIALVVIGVIAIVVIGGAIVLSSKATSTAATNAAQLPINTSANSVPDMAEENARAWGPADAPIKIEEYLDYQCPACGAYNRSYEASVIAAFAKTGKVRYEVHSISFIGQESLDAAEAALCAMDQNKFWQMHNALFANQSGENQNAFNKTRLKAIATQAGLNSELFGTCIDTGKNTQKVVQERTDSGNRGVQQTPTFIINGKLYPGTMGVEDFKKVFNQVAPDVKF